MELSDAGAAIARFDFGNGLHRGSHLVLHPGCVVHRGDEHLETIPLAAIASARVAFERDPRRLGWGVALVGAALVLYLIAGPLAGFASAAAGEVAAGGAQGVARALHVLFRVLELVASLLPVVALALGLAGAALCALGWLGDTRLTLALPGQERAYRARGRNTQLMEFAEALASRLVSLKR